MGVDVLLHHVAEGKPQVMQAPVKSEDATTQSMASKSAYLKTENT